MEYIDLQKEHYGSKTFTINFALIPLYVPHDFLSFDLGDRLGKLICNKDIWWDYSNSELAETSFKNIIQAIELFLFPWFKEKSSTKALKQALLQLQKELSRNGIHLSKTQQLWLSVVDSNVDYSDIIYKNATIFKLPEKLTTVLQETPIN